MFVVLEDTGLYLNILFQVLRERTEDQLRRVEAQLISEKEGSDI
jgi:hypothetical protein